MSGRIDELIKQVQNYIELNKKVNASTYKIAVDGLNRGIK